MSCVPMERSKIMGSPREAQPREAQGRVRLLCWLPVQVRCIETWPTFDLLATAVIVSQTGCLTLRSIKPLNHDHEIDTNIEVFFHFRSLQCPCLR